MNFVLFHILYKMEGDAMRVMTFNLKTESIFEFKNPWKKRKETVLKIIDNYSPDILGVQELTKKMAKDMEQRIDEKYNIIGDFRSKSLSAERNDLLIKKEHDILSYNTFWLSENPHKHGSSIWYAMFPRICTTALIKISDGNILRVYNTHLDCGVPKAREYQVKKLREAIIKNDEKEAVPILVMGDFNAKPNSKAIKDFNRQYGEKKKFASVYTGKTTTMGKFKGKEKGLPIDYIFMSNEFKAIHSEIVRYNDDGCYPSDHYPICADLTIESSIK